MRPELVAWLDAHGGLGWAAPGYATMAGLAALIAAAIVLRLTAREGGDARATATTLLLAYGGALIGGYLYEWIRLTPAAIASGSVQPYLHAGRAAYGGLLFAALAAGIHLRRARAPLGAFFDRIALALGIVYALVRTGCLLEGCDYGVPTDGALGVSYPPGSLAAIDHMHRGWVAIGAPSIATHPTQLYEGAAALVGSAIAWAVRRRGGPEGSAFLAWALVYAIGRAAVEALRADAERGIYAGISSAQWTSAALAAAAIAGIIVLAARARRQVAVAC